MGLVGIGRSVTGAVPRASAGAKRSRLSKTLVLPLRMASSAGRESGCWARDENVVMTDAVGSNHDIVADLLRGWLWEVLGQMVRLDCATEVDR